MKTALPDRVRLRPDPAQWGPDELMSLAEAAALFWPAGPLRTSSLRVAHRNGQLSVAVIARRHLTTRASIEAMALDNLRKLAPRAVPRPAEPAPASPDAETQGDRLRRRIGQCVGTTSPA